MKRLLLFEAGETILEEGDVGESAYLIEEGAVEVSRAKDGKNIVLATLGKGEIFGEMSMIDDHPRGATIAASTAVTVSELHRDEFLDNLQAEPDFAVRFLRTIFERLRDANVRVLQLEQAGAAEGAAGTAVAAADVEAPATDRELAVTIVGVTPEAADSLPNNPYRVVQFPFLIGRENSDPLVHNHWNIRDDRPWQISRHHLKLVLEEGGVSAVDRGSTLGSLVDGKQLGGRSGPPGPIRLREPEGFLVLGQEVSPYRYRVSIEES